MHDLSDYQKATLSAMGISLWRQNKDTDSTTATADNEQVHQSTGIQRVTPSEKPNANSVAMAQEHSNPDLQGESTTPTENTVVQSSPQAVSTAVDRTDPFAQQVLKAAQSVGVLVDRLHWLIEDCATTVEVSDDRLITPPLGVVQDTPGLKKALWQALQTMGSNDLA